jgi:hypothetical protein
MRYAYYVTAALLGMGAIPALAQTPLGGGSHHRRTARPRGRHRRLAASLVAGHTGQAQQSLEMAETRALGRSVAQNQTSTPSDSPLVSRIRDARHALGSGDRTQAIQLIDLALST